MEVRAKFYVSNKAPSSEGGTVSLSPVIDGSEENKRFYHLTPGGNITLSAINQSAFDSFQLGAGYYVDFKRADTVAAAIDDPGAWPPKSAPGTPPALHEQLMEQHRQGQTQHPTHIATEHEQRKRNDGGEK